MRRRLPRWAYLAAFGLLASGRPALADVFVARGSTPVLTHVDVLITEHGSERYQLVEQVSLRSEAPQLVWLRPLPGRATVEPGPQLFSALAAASQPVAPLADTVRARPFGPSVVTLALQRLFPSAPPPEVAGGPGEARDLSIDAVRMFSGETRTSTLSGAITLPRELERFLEGRDAPLALDDRRRVAGWLTRGDWVMAVAAYDRLPSAETPARIGPLLITLPGTPPRYPLARRSTDTLQVVFNVLAAGPRVPGQLPVMTDAATPAPPGGRSVLVYAGPVPPDSELSLGLEEDLSLRLPPNPLLTRARLETKAARLDEVSFGEPAPGTEPLAIESGTVPGTASDLLLCMLLGLAPLVLAPESWLILWIQERARDVARRGGSPLGVKLWALWCFGVAAYWFVALDGVARVAALGPLILGTAQLALPFTERIPSPFRAEIRRPAPTKDLPSGSIRPS